jgi:lipopolysaccharide assembly protein A
MGLTIMRRLHLIAIGLLAAAIIVFAVEIASVTFLRTSDRAPLALLVAIIYLLGIATGGSLLKPLRRAI